MNYKKVSITGIGVVSPIGSNPKQFWKALYNEESGISPIKRFNADRFKSSLAGEAKGFELDEIIEGKYRHEIKRMDRFIQYVLYACKYALKNNEELFQGYNNNEGGIFIGVGMGGLPNMEAGILRQENKGPRKTSPYLIPSLIPNMAASMIARFNQLNILQNTFAGACAGGLQAIGRAYEMIKEGKIKWAIAGGVEAVITPITFSGFEAMRALSKTTNPNESPKPFDEKRDGMVIGEGAAVFLLEETLQTVNRGAKIYGHITGFNSNTSLKSLVSPSTESLVECMEKAIDNSEESISFNDIHCIFSNGSGAKAGDAVEMQAYLKLLNNIENAPAITSIKGNIGHTFAASGPLNLLAALGAFEQKRIPSIRNLENINPQFENLNFVKRPSQTNIKNSLVNVFGFGGINASIIVSIP